MGINLQSNCKLGGNVLLERSWPISFILHWSTWMYMIFYLFEIWPRSSAMILIFDQIFSDLLKLCTYISSPSTVFMQDESITLTSFQVSFCKFKFTGGLKPTLEEKKFLHIDSCGNFCYKSGSGDKAVKRLEYFQKDVIPTNSKIASEAFNSLSQSTCKLDYNLSTSSHFTESTNRYVVTESFWIHMSPHTVTPSGPGQSITRLLL